MKRSQILIVTAGVVLLLFMAGCAVQKTSTLAPKPDAPAPVAKVSTIQRISITEEENYTRVQIEGAEPIAPPLYKLLSDPLRIAIDVPNIDLKEIKSPLKVDNGTIGDVLATQYDDKGRIEISLFQMTNYNISSEEKNLIIDVEKVKKVEETKEAKEGKKEEEALKETKAEPPAVEPKKEEPLPTPAALNKAKKVINVLFEEKKDFITFNVLADGKIENFNAFKLDSPPRLVLDIWGVDTRKNSFKVKNPLIKGVRIGHYQDKLRLVFDSQKLQLPPYQVNRIDDKLIVSLGNIPQPSEPQIYLQEKSAKDSLVASKAPAEARPKPGKPSTLTSIDFKRMDEKSRVILSFSSEDPQFEASTPSKHLIVIDLKNTSALKRVLRRMDTSAFESVVSYIDLKSAKAGKVNDVQVTVKLGEEALYETAKEGKQIFVDIKEKPKKVVAKAAATPLEVKTENAVEPSKNSVKKEEEVKKEEVKKEEKAVPDAKKEEIKPEEKPIPPAVVANKVKVEEVKNVSGERNSQKTYTGRKLSLDFKDADIKNILRLIAEVSNLNIIVADEVVGKITMRLVDVPWDQALELILKTKNLDKRQAGNVVRIAPADVMRKEDQASFEEQRSREKLEPTVVDVIPVNYATVKDIMLHLKPMLTERGDVRIDERTNSFIIKDIPRSVERIKEIVKALDTKTPQIIIEARIVEANLTFQEELGVTWGFLGQGNFGSGNQKAAVGGGLTGVSSALTGPASAVSSSATTPLNSLVGLPAIAQGGIAGVGQAGVIEMLLSSSHGLKQLDIQLSAHENRGNAKIISSPKIATLNNKEASIEQGLRIPYRKLTTEGTITTDFIDANLKLTVTPHVIDDGNIKLLVKAKKDAPDTTVVVDNVPSINKKEAITEVMVKNNGVFVMAGVYSIEKDLNAEGIPFFSKIPLIGWLFKREAKQDLRKDLLIFISPKIVKDEV